MSLYNMLFGHNPISGVLLSMIDLTPEAAGRFRDVYLAMEDGEPVIVVFTRNGGGNREHYDEETEEGPNCDCTGCVIGYQLPAHPLYLRDFDDDFDSTYASVVFRVPEKYRDVVAEIQQQTVDQDKPMERFAKLLDNLKKENTS